RKGQLHKAALKNAPVTTGAQALARVRATAVTPAAAERSSGSTTAMVYDWRVGTSICDRLNRSNNTVIARGRFGMSGTSMRKTFEGRWVKTMVLSRPKRVAHRAAAKAERPAKSEAPKKMLPSMARSTPKRLWNQ